MSSCVVYLPDEKGRRVKWHTFWRHASLGGSKRSYCYCHRLLAGTVCSPTDTLPAYANKKHTVCKLDSR